MMLCTCYHKQADHRFGDGDCLFKTEKAHCKCLKYNEITIDDTLIVCPECLGAGWPQAWKGGRELKNCTACQGHGFIKKIPTALIATVPELYERVK